MRQEDSLSDATSSILFRAVCDNEAEAVFVRDREGRYLAVSAFLAQMVGLEVEDMLGKTPSELYTPENAANADRGFKETIEGGKATYIDDVFRHPDGERWFRTYRTPFHDDDGSVAGIMAVAREITEEKLLRERLAESNSKLQSMVHAVPIPIWIIGRDHHVVFQNESHAELFGRAEEGQTCHGLLHQSEEPCSTCSIEDCLAGQSIRYEWRTPDHKKTYEVLDVPYHNLLTGEQCKMTIFTDVTDRVEAILQLRQTQRLESLGSLAAGIAHDFNNILAGVIGYSQLGSQKADASTDSLELFEQIGSIAERGADLTRKILAFSRRQPLKIRPVDVNTLVEGMHTMVKPLAGDRVELERDLSANVWGVMADSGQIEQVLMNLCVNSVEAMPLGGKLYVSTENVPASEMARFIGNGLEMNGVCIRVRDTGQGMSAEVIDQAMEPFFTTKERSRGTGLGLSVSYGIAKQHGGTIHIESQVGVGTTVSVYLPATNVTPSTLSLPVARRTRGQFKGVSALVVEDDPPIRELVSSFLRDLGMAVSQAGNGSEALSVMDGDRFDVLITDVAMPGINGVELARKAIEACPELPVLFMTGCSESSLEQYGVTDDILLLRKPFSLEDLVDYLNEALNQ